ncbi:fungal-specific transcription factor domain-containing protein [Bisporella sp. PMI_857]|nr:fungal-specific transcription factor domain-containing protein [Bisporella sp. PMI_857]
MSSVPSEGGRPPAKRSNITRVRTGCFTCRKRKKKCDEQKPACANCQKTGVVCEGFPPQIHWETRAALRKAAMAGNENVDLMMMNAGTMQTPMTALGFDIPMDYMPRDRLLSDASSTSFSNEYQGFIPDPQFGNGLDYMFNPQGTAIVMSQRGQQIGGFNPNGCSDMILSADRQNCGFDFPHNAHALLPGKAYIPRELPFLINGVESEMHQRLFCHFTQVMSQVLTISVGDKNPMNGVIIPLALRDRTMMDMLLCLASSHILRLHRGGADNKALHTEKSRLHQVAESSQLKRIHTLGRADFQSATTERSLNRPPDKEVIFATSLLLCLYEICEGTANNTWRTHLDTARQIITTDIDGLHPLTPNSHTNNLTTEIDPFLIEYFLYHDSLAAVTDTSLPLTSFQDNANLAHHDPTMVGVQDGLSDFIFRISKLRAQTDAKSPYPDGNIVAKAVIIWQDLKAWEPKDCLSNERKLIAEHYKWSLYIWLFSLIYPESKADPKIQEAVQRIAGEMCGIKFGDSVMSCLLFPLFVIGSAAIRQEDRDIVSIQFQRLREWSSLGNIDLTFEVLKMLWEDHDSGAPRSWDWVKKLETRGMSLLVT